jgi:ABC-type uncharacterized transport system substrate-binding protein
MARLMQRRQAITFFVGALLLFPFAAAAQPSLPVIGFLSSRSAASDVPMLNVFEQGLRQAGYVAGKNVLIESRWADGQYGRLPSLAADLVRRKVDVIVTAGGEMSALAAKSATADIPIVFNIGLDPVSIGLVPSEQAGRKPHRRHEPPWRACHEAAGTGAGGVGQSERHLGLKPNRGSAKCGSGDQAICIDSKSQQRQ